MSYANQARREKANRLTPNDPDVLPGRVDVAAPDGPNNGENQGYIWNEALRAGLSVRNYGFFLDLARYNLPVAAAKYNIPELRNPFATKTQVAFATNAALRPRTDPYFRGFDNSFPDYWRFREWAREFDSKYATAGLPQLELVRLMHDHTGNFTPAIDGINTRNCNRPTTTILSGCSSRDFKKCVQGQHSGLCHRRRFSGWSRPRGFLPQHRVHRRPLREAASTCLDTLQHG